MMKKSSYLVVGDRSQMQMEKNIAMWLVYKVLYKIQNLNTYLNWTQKKNPKH